MIKKYTTYNLDFSKEFWGSEVNVINKSTSTETDIKSTADLYKFLEKKEIVNYEYFPFSSTFQLNNDIFQISTTDNKYTRPETQTSAIFK